MTRIIKYFLYTLTIYFASSCKKEKDNVTVQTINGMVYNQCTDSGLVNVHVFLEVNKGSSQIQKIETVSRADGTFSFPNVEIHSNSKYNYDLFVPSKSGINGAGGTEVRFDGGVYNFNYDEANTFFKLRVTPGYFLFTITFNQTTISTINDSVVLNCSQNIFHKNVPDLPYKLGGKCYGNVFTQTGNLSNYPMGLWKITIDKWKSGIHTTEQDSIYLGWGATKTYTVNW